MAWAKREGQSVESFFARQRVRQESAGAPAQLDWVYSLDGEETYTARLSVGSPVAHLVLGLRGVLLRQGVGDQPGVGSCEAYWSIDGKDVAEEVAGAQRLVRGGTGDLQLRLDDGSTLWCSARHISPCEAHHSWRWASVSHPVGGLRRR